MTTTDLLQQSVMFAGQSATSQMVTLKTYVEELRGADPNLLTANEQGILKVAETMDSNIPVIDIAIAIRAGGVDKKGFPFLAVAPYHLSFNSQRVRATIWPDGSVRFSHGELDYEVFSLPTGTLPTRFGLSSSVASTAVPLVPLSLRQEDTDGVFLLFEVADWRREIPRPVDPYLLRRLAGHVYAVIGSWDITAKELAAYQAARNLGL